MHVNPLNTKELHLEIQFVGHSRHKFISIIENNKFMFYMTIIAVVLGSKQSREVYSVGRMSKWLILNLAAVKLTARLKRRVMSIVIFHYIILPIALWPWDRLSLYQKWVPGAFPGGKGGRCVRLTVLPPSFGVMKSGNLNFLEPSGPLQACNGTDLPFNYFETRCVILRFLEFCNEAVWPAEMSTASRSVNKSLNRSLSL